MLGLNFGQWNFYKGSWPKAMVKEKVGYFPCFLAKKTMIGDVKGLGAIC